MSNLKQFIDNNYGSIYKTTGGAKKTFGGKNLKIWLKKLLGNRVFDVYTKYLGLKTLTTATLVPFGLILGRQYLKPILLGEQTGGFIPEDIPILDNELLGNYMKLLGLSVINLSPSTLLPLGSVMILYDILTNKLSQDGGGRVIIGSSVPTGVIQTLDYYYRGQTPPEPLLKLTGTNDIGALSCDTGNCNKNVYTSVGTFDAAARDVTGFDDNPLLSNIGETTVYPSWSGELNNLDMSSTKIPHSMAGGSLEPNELFKTHNETYSVPSSQFGGRDLFNYITNPKTGKKVSIHSKKGKQVLSKYINSLKL